ncbi:MAG: NAD(P)H-dependent oxidoreductase subunit E [Paracoccaceae bacterium]|nr:NAD(P)H-dependent oxidoreductase subunit E [Paracoccaceae bacterium]MDG2373258.1 NAD(P)H-dependent oxidoreductase subunit E [Paracoccaceae bacterium]
MDLVDSRKGIWKSAPGKGRKTPKGRQVVELASQQIRELIGELPLRSDLLIEFLHLIQDRFGHLSSEHISALAEEMRLSQVEVYEVASFYAHFDVVKEGEPAPPELTIRVCDSLSCELAGAQELKSALEEGLDPKLVRVLRAPCMGRCDTSPVLELGHNHIDNATFEKVKAAISKGETHLRMVDYEGLDTYVENGGYSTLTDYRSHGDWETVQEAVSASGLRGLGGAGFPSGKKWGFVRAAKGPRYLAVNGDEGEPGTFKDRYYLERTPHLFLEGMLIAAWAIEADKCFIYMRDEYPVVLEILRREIKNLEDKGYISVGFIDLRRGAGAYICGEESAMIESIEGKRGLPRHRPPYVAQVGIFNKPTLVHNVETLHWVAKVCRDGSAVLNSIEKNGRTGLRSYSVSGRIKNPGVYLLPSGSTINDIVLAAGGMLEGHIFKAYQPGGPSSGILPASLDNVPLDFDTLQPLGTFIGSAAVVVLSQLDRVRDAALNMLRFFEDESCGQCTPCRTGCSKAVQLMEKDIWDKEILSDLCQVMEDASICGLGQAAPNPIRLTMKYFPEEIS